MRRKISRTTFLPAFFLAIGLCSFSSAALAQDDFLDTFDEPLLDATRYEELESVRAIETDGSGANHVLSMTSRNGFSTIQLPASLAPSITAISADMTVVESQIDTGQFDATARIVAKFYNDGSSSGPNDQTGDVSAEILFAGTAAFTLIIKCLDPNCFNLVVLNPSVQIGPLSQRTTYTVSLSHNAGAFFISITETETGTLIGTESFSTGDTTFAPAVSQRKAFQIVALSFDDGIPLMVATFDNVMIDTGGGLVLHDDFEASNGRIDRNNWQDLELVRKISDNAALLSVKTSGNDNRFARLRTIEGQIFSKQKLQANLTITDTTFNNFGSGQLRAVITLLFKPSPSNFLNTFFVRAGLRERGNGLERFFLVFRCDNERCSSTTTVPVTITGSDVFSVNDTVPLSVEYDEGTQKLLLKVGGFSGVADPFSISGFGPTAFLVGRARVRSLGFGFDSQGIPGQGAITARVDNFRMGEPQSPGDNTPPVVSVPGGFTTVAASADGAVVDYEATATDDTDGDITPSCAPASGELFPIGTSTVTCTATDAAGNTGTDSFNINVQYAFGGFLAPLREGGTYNLGRTLPVKFQLFFADGSPVTTAKATLQVQMLSNTEPGGDPVDIESTSAADSGNTFRLSEDGYIFNLSTDNLSAGVYRISVDLGDDSGPRTFDIGFK